MAKKQYLDLTGLTTYDEEIKSHINEVASKKANTSDLTSHTSNKSNPHGVTAAQVGAYTKAEIDTTVSSLSSAIGGKAASSHTHDDRYYTESEIDTKVTSLQSSINGKAAKATTLSGYGITDAYTKTEVDSAVSGKATQSNLDAHTGNGDIHVTAAKKTNWDAAYTHSQTPHAPSDAQPNQNAFSKIAVSGQTTVVADTTTDTVTFAGSNVSITTDATNGKVTFTVADGSTSAKGVVQLTDDTSSTSTSTAATPNSVKSAYDLANTAKTNAATAQSKADSAYSLAESKAASSHAHDDEYDAKGSSDTALTDAKSYTDTQIANLINASDDGVLNSITELAEAIKENDTAIEALNSIAASKASASDLTSHTGNTSNPHGVTAAQVGLGNVENKSSATIRGELTKSNVTTALGYTPSNTNVFSTTADGLAPKSDGSTTKYLRADGTWVVPPDNDTTYSNMTGASSSADGKNGLVPAPAAGKEASFLRGDGTWAVPPDTDTTYGVFSTTADGLAPKSDGSTTKYLRADGTWVVPPDNDTVYTHPTSSGNKHIPSGGKSGQILRWSADGTAVWGADNDTTYGVVSTTADGLAPKRTGTTTKFLRDDGTWAVPPDTNTTYGLVSTTADGLAPKRDGSTTKFLRADGTWATPPDTNTHYTSKNVVGSSTATSNTTSALTNGNVYLNSVENGAVTSAHKISGSGATTVTTDTSGNIIISSTDNNTVYTHPSHTAATGVPTSNPTPAFGGTFSVNQITNNNLGHVTANTTRTVTIPSTLSNGTGTAGLIKTTSTVTSNSGYTACPVISGVPYYKDTNTTYSVVSTTADGLAPKRDGSTTKFLRGDGTWAVPPDTNTVYTHPSYTARTGVPASNATLTFGGTFTVTQPVSDATGHITAMNSRTYTMPSDRLFTTLVPTGTAIPANADFNSQTYLKVGRYYCGANATVKTLKNCPVTTYDSSGAGTNGTAFMMEVYSPLSTTIDNEATGTWTYRTRVLTTYTGLQYIQSCYTDGTAGNWIYGTWMKMMSCTKDTQVGGVTQPVYLNKSGNIAACTYKLEANVPSGAKFTDTVTTASTSGSGNAVTAVTASNGALTVTKGDTFMNLSSAQTVSGVKTFSNGIKIGNATLSYSSTDEALVISIA